MNEKVAQNPYVTENYKYTYKACLYVPKHAYIYKVELNHWQSRKTHLRKKNFEILGPWKLLT